nr:hypothetical protein [Pedobacter kyonggii]
MKERQTGPERLPDPVTGIHFDALDFEVWPAVKNMAVNGFDLGALHLEYF